MQSLNALSFAKPLLQVALQFLPQGTRTKRHCARIGECNIPLTDENKFRRRFWQHSRLQWRADNYRPKRLLFELASRKSRTLGVDQKCLIFWKTRKAEKVVKECVVGMRRQSSCVIMNASSEYVLRNEASASSKCSIPFCGYPAKRCEETMFS